MKKIVLTLIILALTATAFTACGNDKNENNSNDNTNSSSISADTTEIDNNSKTENAISFSTKDLNGEDITSDIFKDYDITMVNIWATWCGYCVEEMPHLQSLYEQLPEKTNVISICTDGDSENELAKEIIEKSGVKFKTLISNDEMEKSFLNNYSSFPTTIFVDKNGNVIGDAIVGVPARGDEIAPAYLDAINNAIKLIK